MAVWLLIPGHAPGRCASYRHQVVSEITRQRGPGDPRVAGRSRHEGLSLTRAPDALTPHLLAWCAAGTRLDALTLELRRPTEGAPGGSGREEETPWLSFTLGAVYVASALESVEDTGPLETIVLDYGAIRWVFHGDGPEVVTSWCVYGEPLRG